MASSMIYIFTPHASSPSLNVTVSCSIYIVPYLLLSAAYRTRVEFLGLAYLLFKDYSTVLLKQYSVFFLDSAFYL